ncbi:hypothetical protein ACSBR2_028747 [Camellia fascicularis]
MEEKEKKKEVAAEEEEAEAAPTAQYIANGGNHEGCVRWRNVRHGGRAAGEAEKGGRKQYAECGWAGGTSGGTEAQASAVEGG